MINSVELSAWRKARGERLYKDGWRFARTYRISSQGRRKGWMSFLNVGVVGRIQVHPEVGHRIRELEDENSNP